MNLTETTAKLNHYAEYLGSKNQPFCNFYSGKFIHLAPKILSGVAGNCRIALLTLKDEYEEKCKPFVEILKESGFKVTSIILPDKTLSIELISKMFGLGEDVRAVVALSAKVFGVASYLASVKNLELVCPCEDLEFFKNFYYRLAIKNGDKIDYVNCPAQTHIVLDDNLSQLELSELYALEVSKIPAIFDYKIARLIRGEQLEIEQNKKLEFAYSLFNTAIKSAFNVFTLEKEKQGQSLILQALSILMANAYAGGEFLDCSCPVAVERLLSADAFNGHALLYATSAMLSCYDMIFSDKYKSILETPDYIDRASQLKSIFGCGERQFLEGLKTQISLINDFDKSKLGDIKDSIKISNKPVFNLGDKLINTYHALGGKGNLDKKAVISAVNLSGDLPEFINGMSLVRESGLAEMMTRLFTN